MSKYESMNMKNWPLGITIRFALWMDIQTSLTPLDTF